MRAFFMALLTSTRHILELLHRGTHIRADLAPCFASYSLSGILGRSARRDLTRAVHGTYEDVTRQHRSKSSCCKPFDLHF